MKWRRLVIWSAAAIAPLAFDAPPLIYWTLLVCAFPWVLNASLIFEPKWDMQAELDGLLGRG